MTTSLREQAFNSNDLGGELVPVPEWGEKWEGWVRGLEAGERNAALLEARREDGSNNSDVFYARIVQLTALDPADKTTPIFATDDLPLLLRKSSVAVDKLANVALRLSGMDKAGVEAAVNEAGKDSSKTPKEGSTTK